LIRDTLRGLWRLWGLGVDVVCDLEFFARYSTLMAYLSGARTRVGYFSRIAWRGHLLTHPVYYNGTKHITRIFLAQAEILGAHVDEDVPVQLPSLARDASAADRAAAVLAKHGVAGDRPLLVVNPNASALCLERRWMPERFADVVDALLADDPELRAVFIGARAEIGHTQSVVDRCQAPEAVVSLAGELGLRELAELLRRARLFLTNDSGPLHLATLVDTPTVSLFGPETPTLYGPLGRRQRLFYAGVYCSPCLNVYNAKTAACGGDNICLKAFGDAPVLQACRELLAQPGEGHAGSAAKAAVAS
jgi:ADP-heptose:LPS heptosyltransferase